MRVPVKLLGFVVWLFFFNCGQCQECRREDITFENTEQAPKASYKDGDTERVKCMPGFTGMYRIKCDNGVWKTTSSRPCAKKKCSHPGDTPNGQFIITQGSEFVFGATVLYTCKKGFEMTSRINQRTCRAQGWDNTVPVCEAVKCPAIHTDQSVTASGNTEEGSYGDVIHFECISSDKKLDGSSDIHCTETGEWSDSVPMCKEITCTAPAIPNGDVIEQVQEYRKDAILKYRCLQGFKPREGSPRCAKFGWTLNPQCDEITCLIQSTTFGVKTINPAGKTIFRAGEKVEITCAEKYWIFGTKQYTKSLTCQDDGKWDREPVCMEIRCEVPHYQHVKWLTYYFSGDMKLGVKKSYACESGYYQVEPKATCTRDGWTPNPLCERRCAAPTIPNAEIVGDRSPNYRISSRIQYKCDAGFEPEEPVQITCNYQTEWTGIQRCTAVKECGALPRVQHGIQKPLKKTVRHGEKTAFECDPGFKPTPPLLTCVSGTWETPVCEGCGIPPKVENALITSKPEEFYVDGSITYKCRSSFSINGESTVSCLNGIWGKTPTCEAVKECGTLPSVPHGKLNQTTHDQAEVECDPGFIPTPSLIKCVSGTWETTVCEEIRCEVPDDKNVFNPGSYFSGEMKLGAKKNYYCKPGYDPVDPVNPGEPMATCTKNGWTPNPLCAKECGALPSVPHGKLNQTTHDQAEVECDPGFIPTPSLIKCVSGKWETTVCEEIRCEVPDDKNVFNPGSYFSGEIKLGAKKNYYCKPGYDPVDPVDPGEPMATCTKNGWTPNPLCASPT